MRIYTWLEDKLNVTFNTISGVNIGDRISSYISEKRNSTENSLRTTNIETWDSFVEQLEVQQSQRKTKLIPETCALHFKEGFKNNSDSTVVEACYYEK
jgi:predicted transcriptional regulator